METQAGNTTIDSGPAFAPASIGDQDNIDVGIQDQFETPINSIKPPKVVVEKSEEHLVNLQHGLPVRGLNPSSLLPEHGENPNTARGAGGTRGPRVLSLLDLPIEILKDIVTEVCPPPAVAAIQGYH